MIAGVLSGLLAGLALWFLLPGPARLRRPVSAERGQPAWTVVPAIAGIWWLLGLGHVVLLAIAAITAVAAVRRIGAARARAVAERRADQVLLACQSMAAELAAGQPPQHALARAAEDWTELEPVAVAADLGADVPETMREVAHLPGAAQLLGVAAAWQVAHRSGSGLADALRATAVRVGDERATRRLVSGELAAARATAHLMAGLPVLVLLLGSGIGGDPVGFLLDEPVGLGCLATGLLLTWAGLVWLDRIAVSVLDG